MLEFGGDFEINHCNGSPLPELSETPSSKQVLQSPIYEPDNGGLPFFYGGVRVQTLPAASLHSHAAVPNVLDVS